MLGFQSIGTGINSSSAKKKEALVVVDRGMAFDDNLQSIKKRGYHYLVACRQPERNQWLADYEEYDGWEDSEREVSASNPGQEKSRVQIKRLIKEEETMVLCISDGRREKDRAIREVLKTHQVATVVLPTSSGEELHIRRGTVPEPQHVEIYDNLGIPHEPMKPVKKWQTHAENSD